MKLWRIDLNIEKNLCVQFIRQQKAELVACDWDQSAPEAHEIIGKTLVSLISSGSERGGYMNYYGGAVYPMSTGYANVMEVLAVGDSVLGVQPGDLVFTTAPHNAYNRVQDDAIAIVPKGMDPEHAVIGRIPAVTMTSMIETNIRPTEPVLVTGLGIVGLMCAQMMQHCGYEVYATDPMENRRQVACACGLRHVLATLDEAPEIKGKVGLAIECSGMEEAAYAALDVIRKGGELSLVGVPWYRSTDVDGHTLLRKIFYGYVHVHSGWEWSIPRHSAEFLPNSNYASFTKAMEWIRDGFIRVDGIYQTESPRDCDRVYSDISTGKLAKTCAVFDWRKV
jgi:NADPH:quinone reductase-like Zn-dependent oxidoreductase